MLFRSRQILQTPAAIGLEYRDVELTAFDGVRLHAWHIPGKSQNNVLFLHGNAGNISHRLEKLAILHNLGVGVLILDYRGYGRSEGNPSEPGTYRDAEAAFTYLASSANIILYGESLGTGVAIELAMHHRVRGVILEAPFTSVPDVGQELFPYLPIRLLARTRYDNLRKIPQLNAPLLILHSRDDEVFSFTHAQRLFAAAPEPKRLVELRGGHNDSFVVSAEVYTTALRQFLHGLDGAASSR